MGWEVKRLEEVFDIARGGSPRPIKSYITDAEDGINWIKISDATASSKYITETKEKIKPEGKSRSRYVKKGDFLLSNSMSFGRPYIMGTDGCIHDGWLVLSPKEVDHVDQNFLYYLLGSPLVFRQFDSRAAGSTVRNLNIGLASSVEIPVPPFEEQKKIVAILDQAFAEIDKARANAEQNLNNARELFDSYLNQVFSQRGEGWEEATLSELGEITSSKRIYKSEYIEEGIPFYRTKEVKELANNSKISTEYFISTSKYEELREKFGAPKKGDILLTAIGTIGEIYVVNNDNPFYFKDGNVLWLKNFESLSPEFLKYALKAFVNELRLLSKGAAYNALPINQLKSYKISYPKIYTQKDIVKSLNELSRNVSSLEKKYTKKLEFLEELKKSILHKAFSGELT